jgi:Ca2+-dependent lipid-binding protein
MQPYHRTLPVLRKGKIAGEIKCDLQYFPINKPDKEEDGTIIPAVESSKFSVSGEKKKKYTKIPPFFILSDSGILRFTVHECKDLSSRSKGISPYAVMKMNGIEKLRTKAFKRSINPRWDKTVECFIADKSKLALDLNILDADHSLGSWSSTLLNAGQQEWWNLKDNSGKVHISMLWKPVTMTGFNEGFEFFLALKTTDTQVLLSVSYEFISLVLSV